MARGTTSLFPPPRRMIGPVTSAIETPQNAGPLEHASADFYEVVNPLGTGKTPHGRLSSQAGAPASGRLVLGRRTRHRFRGRPARPAILQEPSRTRASTSRAAPSSLRLRPGCPRGAACACSQRRFLREGGPVRVPGNGNRSCSGLSRLARETRGSSVRLRSDVRPDRGCSSESQLRGPAAASGTQPRARSSRRRPLLCQPREC
jgi:hypothetical protein